MCSFRGIWVVEHERYQLESAKLVFARRFPTVERRVQMIQKSSYVAIPEDEELLQYFKSQVMDVHPAFSLLGKDNGLLKVLHTELLEEYKLQMYPRGPIVELRMPKSTQVDSIEGEGLHKDDKRRGATMDIGVPEWLRESDYPNVETDIATSNNELGATNNKTETFSAHSTYREDTAALFSTNSTVKETEVLLHSEDSKELVQVADTKEKSLAFSSSELPIREVSPPRLMSTQSAFTLGNVENKQQSAADCVHKNTGQQLHSQTELSDRLHVPSVTASKRWKSAGEYAVDSGGDIPFVAASFELDGTAGNAKKNTRHNSCFEERLPTFLSQSDIFDSSFEKYSDMYDPLIDRKPLGFMPMKAAMQTRQENDTNKDVVDVTPVSICLQPECVAPCTAGMVPHVHLRPIVFLPQRKHTAFCIVAIEVDKERLETQLIDYPEITVAFECLATIHKWLALHFVPFNVKWDKFNAFIRLAIPFGRIRTMNLNEIEKVDAALYHMDDSTRAADRNVINISNDGIPRLNQKNTRKAAEPKRNFFYQVHEISMMRDIVARPNLKSKFSAVPPFDERSLLLGINTSVGSKEERVRTVTRWRDSLKSLNEASNQNNSSQSCKQATSGAQEPGQAEDSADTPFQPTNNVLERPGSTLLDAPNSSALDNERKLSKYEKIEKNHIQAYRDASLTRNDIPRTGNYQKAGYSRSKSTSLDEPDKSSFQSTRSWFPKGIRESSSSWIRSINLFDSKYPLTIWLEETFHCSIFDREEPHEAFLEGRVYANMGNSRSKVLVLPITFCNTETPDVSLHSKVVSYEESQTKSKTHIKMSCTPGGETLLICTYRFWSPQLLPIIGCYQVKKINANIYRILLQIQLHPSVVSCLNCCISLPFKDGIIKSHDLQSSQGVFSIVDSGQSVCWKLPERIKPIDDGAAQSKYEISLFGELCLVPAKEQKERYVIMRENDSKLNTQSNAFSLPGNLGYPAVIEFKASNVTLAGASVDLMTVMKSCELASRKDVQLLSYLITGKYIIWNSEDKGLSIKKTFTYIS